MLSRLRNLVHKLGLRGAAKTALRYAAAQLWAVLCPPLLLRPRATLRLLRARLAGNYTRVILWRSGFGFRTALYQRPQQLARQFARLGCLMLYEASPVADRVAVVREEEPGLLLVNMKSPLLRLLLERELRRLDRPRWLQLYSTDREMSLRTLRGYQKRGWSVLFEYVDALSPAISGTKRVPKRVREKFRYVMACPEIPVIVTAEALRRDVLRRRGERRLALVTNGVDLAFFQRWDDYDFEPAFRAILERGRPVVCYYGALAAWLDYALLRAVADSGRYSLVLIGVKYDGSFDSALRSAPNVDWLGPRDYRVLKYYARAADLLILPFRVCELTRATSPVKLFEYMALGKPVVSTDVDECRRYQSVLIGKDHADFLRQLERGLSLRGDPDYLALLEREAHENDWRGKAEAILRMLDEGTAAK